MDNELYALLQKTLSKVDRIDQNINNLLIKFAESQKDIESNQRHIHKYEGALGVMSTNVIRNTEHVQYLLKKKDSMVDDIEDLKKVGKINWINAFGKYVPYILSFGALSLLLAESPIRKVIH